MAKNYWITITGNDISRARIVNHEGDLESAKERAEEEFGDGFLHHTIAIYDSADNTGAIALRKVGETVWYYPC